VYTFLIWYRLWYVTGLRQVIHVFNTGVKMESRKLKTSDNTALVLRFVVLFVRKCNSSNNAECSCFILVFHQVVQNQ